MSSQQAVTARLVAVSGGLGSPSSTRLLSDRVLEHAKRALDAHGLRAEVTVVELRPLAVQIANHLVTGYAEPELAAALAAVREADGIVAVTPVFNGSMAGLFKSFFDLLNTDDLTGTPVVLGATGGSARHSLVIDYAMRPLFAYLRTLPMPTGIFVATADWGAAHAGTSEGDEIEVRVARVARELASAVRLGVAGGSGHQGGASQGSGDAPTIAATVEDFTDEARAANERRAEHAGFADLMSRYAGTELTD